MNGWLRTKTYCELSMITIYKIRPTYDIRRGVNPMYLVMYRVDNHQIGHSQQVHAVDELDAYLKFKGNAMQQGEEVRWQT